MKTGKQLARFWVALTVTVFLSAPLHALIVNGGFEAGFAGWTRVDQIGGDGTFLLQTGNTSPVNGFAVPAPPQGANAAMTDSAGPGSHVLYQDFVVTGGMTAYTLGLSLYINNGYGAPDFVTPGTLDFATTALNQRARIDIMTTGSNPFSLAAGDVLQNLFQTDPGESLVSGYNNLQFDISALLQANQGNTLRLRFAQVDNVAPFNMGIDAVDIRVGGNAVPDSLPWMVEWVFLAGVLAVGGAWRRLRLRQRTE